MYMQVVSAHIHSLSIGSPLALTQKNLKGFNKWNEWETVTDLTTVFTETLSTDWGSFVEFVWKLFHPLKHWKKNFKMKDHMPAVQGDFVNRCFKTEKMGGWEQNTEGRATEAMFQDLFSVEADGK